MSGQASICAWRMRRISPEIELRYPDGRAWSGKGGFGYVQEARIIGQ
jgi:hypothetical protein